MKETFIHVNANQK